VLVPGTGRPWPTPAIYGDRFEYGPSLWLFAAAATVVVAVLTLLVARRRAVADEVAAAPSPSKLKWAIGALLVALVVGIAIGPSTDHGAAPQAPGWLWLLPATFMLGALLWLAQEVRAGVVWMLAAVAVVTSAFVADRYMPDLGPHWSQKHVIAAYYAHRKGHEEPLIVWNLYWRGENFYTRNEVYDLPSGDPWAWTEPSQVNMKGWFEKHKGRKVFFLVERTKVESLRAQLPAGSRQLEVVDDSNNKLELVETTL
jgi:hypothetical protein